LDQTQALPHEVGQKAAYNALAECISELLNIKICGDGKDIAC